LTEGCPRYLPRAFNKLWMTIGKYLRTKENVRYAKNGSKRDGA